MMQSFWILLTFVKIVCSVSKKNKKNSDTLHFNKQKGIQSGYFLVKYIFIFVYTNIEVKLSV